MKKKFIIVSTISTTLNFFNGQIAFLNRFFDVELVSSPDEVLYLVSEREGVKVHPIKMVREISLFKDLKGLLQLIKLFITLKPHVVHGNTPKGGLLSMTAAWITRVPHRIYFIHGLRYEGETGLKRKIILSLERISCFFATDLIAVSFGVKENILKNRISKKIPQVIGNGSANGINPDIYSRHSLTQENLRETYKISQNHLVFGFVGRLVSDKGINELVTVFIELNKTHPNIKLLLVGWYEDELDPLQEHIKQEIITNENIIAVGAQKNVLPFLNMVNVFVFPSYREGFGVSIMEAAAMELPVICSDISGCNEIIKDGYNGKLIQHKSTSALMKAMESFIKKPEQIKQMGEVTRDYILKKYNQKDVWKEALNTYQKVVNS
ncbi:glycosyltransferase family 4 protein [Gaetbulibacter sp. M235]|uniref:glycosyltransferase family 4 protein n=1 Tax=Gaetbulibacter sp. M235 TaxID=3126510 RepID=UPI00374F5D7D